MVAKEVENLWEENLDEYLTDEHGIEIKLLIKTFKNFKKKKATTVNDLIFESKMVLNRTWEMLNVGKWMNVPEEKKQVYAIASFIQIVGLLNSDDPEAIKKCLEVTDMGILLGFPFRSILLTSVADILSKSICEDERATDSETLLINVSNEGIADNGKTVKPENEIDSLRCPSLEHFYNNYLIRNRPVKLTGCIDHWPALKLWKDFRYIIKKAGCRTVPIEIGKHYADESYSQKLMKVSEFVKEFFREDAERIGYLAQHQLFDQVPELRRDIIEPDYCALSQNVDKPDGPTEINAWFGPKGTVSPLHFDPKNNLLCQVVGSKKIILYTPEDSKFLYPHESTLLFNTSRVDVENPDLTKFPDFSKAAQTVCVLNAGDILYIPPKHWHHVRSLENSFSVSFWWE